MNASKGVLATVAGAALCALAACGAPGLPPAGPAPGDVDVGYGTQPEGKVTGAVVSLPEDEVGKARPLRIEELLRGKVAGLQVTPLPGGGFSFRIRGTNSLLADQEPLFVLDDMPIQPIDVQSVLAGLTPGDIRQIDVLKDVSSTAIYGTRGAGGVVLVTTRR